MSDALSAVIELAHAVYLGAPADEVRVLVERAVALVELETELVFAPDDETLEAAA